MSPLIVDVQSSQIEPRNSESNDCSVFLNPWVGCEKRSPQSSRSQSRTRAPSLSTQPAGPQALIDGGGDLSGMPVSAITIDTMRTAFARYAETHEAASIQRCWSTWNVLCTFLYTAELIASNPMPMVGRPKLAKTLPKALPADAVAVLLGALGADQVPRRRTDWMQRDRALILTALLAGLRADELVRANVGDLRRTDDGAVIHVARQGRQGPPDPDRIGIGRRSSSTIWTAERLASRPRPNGAPPPAGDWPPGRRQRPCSSAPMVTGSRAAPCNTGCCARSAAPASTPTAPAAHLSTGCATRSLSVLPVTVCGTWVARRDTPVPYEYPVIRGTAVTFGTWSRLGPNGRCRLSTDLSCGWCSTPSW